MRNSKNNSGKSLANISEKEIKESVLHAGNIQQVLATMRATLSRSQSVVSPFISTKTTYMDNAITVISTSEGISISMAKNLWKKLKDSGSLKISSPKTTPSRKK